MGLNSNTDTSDALEMERVFLTGVLDELKFCFNYNRQVKPGEHVFLCSFSMEELEILYICCFC